jgi:hypothetical protein
MLVNRPSALKPSFDIELEVSKVSDEVPEGAIPPKPEDFIEQARKRQEEMVEEGNEPQAYAEATSQTVAGFIRSAPDGLGFGEDTSCAGVGCSASGGGTQYSIERVVGRRSFNEEPDVTKIGSDGSEQVVGTIDSPGRMNGDFGWSSDNNLIAGALASFTHNWVGTLMAYFDRPQLPFNPDNDGWQLPNMVLEETEKPDQFHPVGSFGFDLRPSYFRRFTVDIVAPSAATVGIDLWDSEGSSISRIEGQEIEKGQSQLLISSFGYGGNSGTLNINPLDAPDGITITNVSSVPRAL